MHSKDKNSIVKVLMVIVIISMASAMLISCEAVTDKIIVDSGDVTLLDFTGIVFEDVSYDHDGTIKSIVATGIPTGATATYTNNTATDVGEYTAEVTVTQEGYNTYTATAILTIVASGDSSLPYFTTIVFDDVSYDYDGSEKSVLATGIPTGADVSYTGNTGTNAGTYNASVSITQDGYNPYTGSAVLTINKLNFSGISFDDVSCNYDGSEKNILATGIPTGATPTYAGNVVTDAGTYNASVTVTMANYNDYTDTATLTINKISLPTITFDSWIFDYDAGAHSITVTGNIPSGVVVTYSGGENGANSATSVGVYAIQAVVSGVNYITHTLNATIRIVSLEQLLSTAVYDSEVYFQNSLDNNKMYKYDGTSVEKVNNEKPEYFTEVGGELYYMSPSLLSSGIASFDGTNSENLLPVNAEYLINDGTNLYFAVNNLFSISENGIYKISVEDINDDSIDPVPTRLTTSKAAYLVYSNGYVYFSNKDDGSKLYRISSTANNGTATLVYDYNVSDIIVDNGHLYFTRHFTLTNMSAGAAIFSIDTNSSLTLPLTDESTEITKITYSKGKYLAIAGSYIYFVNTDLVTSTVFGDGIYRVAKDGSSWVGDTFSLLTGASLVVDATDDNVYSLSTDGTDLYYYRTSDKHLYTYEVASETEVDIMEGFVVPEYPTVIATYYEKMEQYNGELYYINMRDGGRLYKYSIPNDAEYRITGLRVADFAIDGDYLYYSSVRFGVNFDLYKMNLTTGALIRISTEKCMHLAFSDDAIYYANFTDSNTLNKMDLDGQNDTIIFDDETVEDFSVYYKNGIVYFVADNLLYTYEDSTAAVLNSDLKPNEYKVVDGKIYLMNDKAFSNNFSEYDISSDTVNDFESLGTTNDARSFFISGDYIYYYRNVGNLIGSSNKGLYKVDMTAETPVAVLVDGLDVYYMCYAQVIGNKVYFIDVWQVKGSVPEPTNSTGNLCVLNLDNNNIEVLAD